MMWIMGYNDGVESLSSIQDPLFNGRNEHRPLMPRPAITALGSSSQAFNFATTIHNPTTATHDHLLALNHYHLAMAEHSRRELSTQQVVVNSRWNPTPEQLQTLEELYRRGTRTPSAEQIQQITAQLRRYGKIEGKNVFYWFQNHKARERQKRRRQIMVPSSDEQRQPQNNDVNSGNEENGTAEKRESITGTNRTSYEVAQTTMNGHSNSITIAEQKTLSAQGRTKAAECKSDHGWAQFGIDDAELLHQRRNATWHAMQLSCNSSSPTNLINSCSVATTVTTNPSTVVLGSPSSTDIITCSNIQEPMVNNLFFQPYFVNAHENLDDDNGDNHHDAQTLQLFPLRSDGEECVSEGESGPSMLRNATSTSFTISPNYQFFEFLPLKN